MPEASYLARTLALIDKSQLRQLCTEKVLLIMPADTMCSYLQQLPQLQQLHMALAVIGDQVLQCMLTHPSLSHVSIPNMQLRTDHSAVQPACLQEIQFSEAVHICTLAALPLASLNRCTILSLWMTRSQFRGFDSAALDAALSKVALHQDKVICQPRPSRAMPSFHLDVAAHYSTIQVQQAISMCTRNLPRGTAVVMHAPPATTLAALAAALPATITTIVFEGDITSLLQPQGSFINLLPAHVDTVELMTANLSMEQYQQIFLGVTRRVGIVVQYPRVDNKVVEPAWLKDIIVNDWLSTYPNQVQVEVVMIRFSA